MSIFRASVNVGLMTLGSRLLGLVRDVMLAQVLGASGMSDAFMVAQRLPNMMRQLLAEGAFNVAYVPLLSRRLQDDARQGEQMAGEIGFWLLVVSTLVAVLFMVFMPQVIHVFAPGFAKRPDTFALAVGLSRITFPYLVFIVMTSFMGGTLNSIHRFTAAAASPMLLNLAYIFCLLVLPKYVGAYHAAALSLPLGGVLQVGLLLWAIWRSTFTLRVTVRKPSTDVTLLLKRMTPSMIGVGAQQINSFISTVLASLLAPASITYLYYADRLNQLPLGLIGIAIATALLPSLSRSLRAGGPTASRQFEQCAAAGLALGAGAAAGLIVFSTELMVTLFERGAFGPAAVQGSAAALVAFAIGLPAYILVKIAATTFYAAEDTRTPLRCGLVSIGVNIVLNLALMPVLAHVGLALATAIAAWVNAGQLLWFIRKRNLLPHWSMYKFTRHGLGVVAASLVLAGTGELWRHFIPLPGHTLLRFAWLFGAIVACLIPWGGVLWATGIARTFKRGGRGSFATQPATPTLPE